MKIGIVGADETKWSDTAKPKLVIHSIIDHARCNHLMKENGDIGDTFSGDAVIVSGHCPKGGVDIWAEEQAIRLGISMEIKHPICTHPDSKRYAREIFHDHLVEIQMENKHYWLYHYRPRNIQIVQAVDVLYTISPKCICDEGFIPAVGEDILCEKCKGTDRVYNGGEWTGNYAKELGKNVIFITI